jgi:hypothetical protein
MNTRDGKRLLQKKPWLVSDLLKIRLLLMARLLDVAILSKRGVELEDGQFVGRNEPESRQENAVCELALRVPPDCAIVLPTPNSPVNFARMQQP